MLNLKSDLDYYSEEEIATDYEKVFYDIKMAIINIAKERNINVSELTMTALEFITILMECRLEQRKKPTAEVR